MVNPSLGAPAFVARLLLIFSLKHDFHIKQVNTVMDIVHKSGGYVFLVMTDNLSVNQKIFNVHHQENVSTALYSIRRPINNPVFDHLYIRLIASKIYVIIVSQSLPKHF